MNLLFAWSVIEGNHLPLVVLHLIEQQKNMNESKIDAINGGEELSEFSTAIFISRFNEVANFHHNADLTVSFVPSVRF